MILRVKDIETRTIETWKMKKYEKPQIRRYRNWNTSEIAIGELYAWLRNMKKIAFIFITVDYFRKLFNDSCSETKWKWLTDHINTDWRVVFFRKTRY